MKLNKEWILIGSLIFLLSAYLIFRNQNRINYKLPKLKTPVTKTVNRIEIIKSNSSLLLIKQDHKWLISPKNYPASDTLVHQMLDQAIGLNLDVPVSESGNLRTYGLSDDQKITVRLVSTNVKKKKNSVFEFYLGTKAPTQRHTYVMIKGHKTVYQAVGDLRKALDRSATMLRDKGIFDIPQKEVTNVVLENKGQKIATLSLQSVRLSNATSQSDYWKASEGWDAQAHSMQDLLGALSRLQCQGYLEDAKPSDFNKKTPLYRITFSADQNYTLSIHEQKDGMFTATASTSPYVFVLPKWQAERLMKKRKDLVQRQ